MHIAPVRTFLRRLINLTIGLKKASPPPATSVWRQAWQVFLDNFNEKVFLPLHIVHSTFSLHFFTDAINLGVFGTKWFSEEFSQKWVSCNISVREFLPIVIAFGIWGLVWLIPLLSFIWITLQSFMSLIKLHPKILSPRKD